jgi:hypothetical protein
MVVIAPHGGMIERYTDCQAERVAVELSGISCWRCNGWKPDNGAFDRWRITSTDIHEASFPLLKWASTGRRSGKPPYLSAEMAKKGL